MKKEFWNGNMAAAQAAKLARSQVIAAYPVTPQTHTVEYLSQFIANGELKAELVKVESEHSALSVCAGASAVGARAFTASCSQGLQLMSEAPFYIRNAVPRRHGHCKSNAIGSGEHLAGPPGYSGQS